VYSNTEAAFLTLMTERRATTAPDVVLATVGMSLFSQVDTADDYFSAVTSYKRSLIPIFRPVRGFEPSFGHWDDPLIDRAARWSYSTRCLRDGTRARRHAFRSFWSWYSWRIGRIGGETHSNLVLWLPAG